MNRENFLKGWILRSGRLSVILVIFCALLFAAGCTAPQQTGVKMNDTVRVYYTVSFPDGTVFQSNVNETPLEFTVGTGEVIAGFDEAVLGMTPGMTKTVTINPEKGYGEYRPELVRTISIDSVVSSFGKVPEVGPIYLWEGEKGEVGYVRFSNVTSETITVDENHPLAGKDLIYEITLIEIPENAS
jgi:peptidylprolyl isomerase